MSYKGVDVRASGDRVVFRASLKDSGGNELATGTTLLRLFELQPDGTLKQYDFSTNAFVATAPVTPTLAMSHQAVAGYATGIWTAVLATLAGFTRGNIYFAKVSNPAASVPGQEREWQYGEAEGDFTVNPSGQVVLSAVGADQVLVAGKTLPQALRYIGATVAGTLLSGAGQGTEAFHDFAGAVAVTITVDASGNRTSVVYT